MENVAPRLKVRNAASLGFVWIAFCVGKDSSEKNYCIPKQLGTSCSLHVKTCTSVWYMQRGGMAHGPVILADQHTTKCSSPKGFRRNKCKCKKHRGSTSTEGVLRTRFARTSTVKRKMKSHLTEEIKVQFSASEQFLHFPSWGCSFSVCLNWSRRQMGICNQWWRSIWQTDRKIDCESASDNEAPWSHQGQVDPTQILCFFFGKAAIFTLSSERICCFKFKLSRLNLSDKCDVPEKQERATSFCGKIWRLRATAVTYFQAQPCKPFKLADLRCVWNSAHRTRVLWFYWWTGKTNWLIT